jgi:predicted dehydrogenase
VQFGLIGSGSIAQRYATIIKSHYRANLIVITDFPHHQVKSNISFSRDEGNDYFHKNNISFDLLIIASENLKHISDFDQFSKFSSRILIEKPLSHKALANPDLIALEQFPGLIRVSSPLRFHEGFVRVLENIHAVGDINFVEVRCQSWLPNWRPNREIKSGFWNDSAQGGVLREIIHELDYLDRLFGSLSVEWISQSNSVALNLEVESGISAILSTASGINVDLRLDFSSHESRRHLRVDGDKGTLTWNVLKGEVQFFSNSREDSNFFPQDLVRNLTFIRQIDSVLDHKKWPIEATSVKEASKVLKLVDTMYAHL